MFANPHTRITLQTEWLDMIRMRDRIHNLVTSTFAFNASISPAFGDILYNLPLRLAFEVLKKALLQAKAEGLIPTSQQRLSDLMDSAVTSLPWTNWQALREAVRRRNQVVYEGKLLGNEQCLRDIADVEAQLIAWRIITSV